MQPRLTFRTLSSSHVPALQHALSHYSRYEIKFRDLGLCTIRLQSIRGWRVSSQIFSEIAGWPKSDKSYSGDSTNIEDPFSNRLWKKKKRSTPPTTTKNKHHLSPQANRRSASVHSHCLPKCTFSYWTEIFSSHRQRWLSQRTNRTCPMPCYKATTHTRIHTVPWTHFKSSSDRW